LLETERRILRSVSSKNVQPRFITEYAKTGDFENGENDVWDVIYRICCTYVALIMKGKLKGLPFAFLSY
jgi:hypothetical protein